MTTKYSEGCELVRRWRASGKNQSEFCRAVGIAPQRLHYWRQRVREEDLEPPKAAPSFVAVQVRPPAPGAGVEVVLGNGRWARTAHGSGSAARCCGISMSPANWWA